MSFQKFQEEKSLTTLLPWDVQLVAKSPAEEEFPALKYKTWPCHTPKMKLLLKGELMAAMFPENVWTGSQFIKIQWKMELLKGPVHSLCRKFMGI